MNYVLAVIGYFLSLFDFIVKNDQAIVIDYKKDKSSEAYQAQVQRYMQAMKALGYPNATDFLVYVEEVEVEEVI